jgi:hypothetical protein
MFGEEDLVHELALGFACGPAFPFGYKGTLFPVVYWLPCVLGLVKKGIAGAML